MTFRFTLILLVFIPVLLFGQFGRQQEIYKGTGATNISAAADFNQDGYIDIAIGTRRHLLIYEGTATPLEYKERIINDGAVRELEISDMDGDGDIDIFVLQNRKSILFENKGGDFSFVAQVLIDEDIWKRGFPNIEIVDFNQDGYKDVLLLWEPYSDISIISINESISYQYHKNLLDLPEFGRYITIEDLPLSYALIDYNKNGMLDLALSHHKADTSRVYFFDISMESPTLIDSLRTEEAIKNLNTADFDRDGDLDLLVTTKTDLYWMMMTEEGLTERVNIPFDFQSDRITEQLRVDSRIIDWNQDGFQDILYFYEATNQSKTETEDEVLMIYNNGDGTYYDTILNSNYLDVLNYFLLSTYQPIDLNRDGTLDLLRTSRAVQVTLSDMEHNIVSLQPIRDVYVNILGTCDANQDGYNDIVTHSFDGGNISFWFNDGQQNFTEDTVLVNQALRYNFFIEAEDIDADGLLDIILPACNPDSLIYSLDCFFLYKGKSDGTLSEPILVDSYYDYLVDIDGDSDLDIVFWDRTLNEFLIRKNTPDGFLEPKTIDIPTDEQLYKGNIVSIVDLDNDDFADIIIQYHRNDKQELVWYKGNENERFEEQGVVASNDTPHYREYKFFHFNGDGKIDILAYQRYDVEHEIIINNGDGIFSLSEYKFEENNPVRYNFIDLQGDGLHDLFTFYNMYVNTGNSFEKIELPSYFVPGSISVYEDLDNDGDEDLIGRGSDLLYWHENLLTSTRIVANTFFDENENGFFDDDEFLLFDISSQLLPDIVHAFPSISSGKTIYYPSPGSYELLLEKPEGWSFTTDSIYQINIDDQEAQDYYFGLIPNTTERNIQNSIASSPTRCGFEVDFWLNYANEGYLKEQGEISLVLDERTTFVRANPSPTRQAGNTFYWAFEDLKPTYKEQIRLTIQMPGVDAIGDTLDFVSQMFQTDENNFLQLTNTEVYRSEVRCAYDPNDKQVIPNRLGNENYTLFDEPLEYTIRFQNTGTDTAFNVMIRDYLDESLDWTSFKPLHASHSFETTLNDKTGLVEFSFKDILLADSIINEPASHGYVKYRIEAKNGLDENTAIKNTANIFFDFNPPIETNTIQNTMVSKLPKKEELPTFETTVKVYPNPFDTNFRVEVFSDENELAPQNFLLFDNLGRQVLRQMVNTRSFEVNTHSLPNGIYFYQLISAKEMVGSGRIVRISAN